MRVGTFTAGLLAGAVVCLTGLAAPAQTNSGKVSIPMTVKAQNKTAPAASKTVAAKPSHAKPPRPTAKMRAAKRLASRKAAARRAALRHRANFYDYAAAQPVRSGGWREEWLAHRGMRHAHYAPPPPPQYGPPPVAYDPPGIEIDRGGWTGGVGYGTSGDFVDGYGMLHYGWNNRQNGPTYNSYGQSFQHNPSVAGPFQPRRMGQPIPAR